MAVNHHLTAKIAQLNHDLGIEMGKQGLSKRLIQENIEKREELKKLRREG